MLGRIQMFPLFKDSTVFTVSIYCHDTAWYYAIQLATSVFTPFLPLYPIPSPTCNLISLTHSIAHCDLGRLSVHKVVVCSAGVFSSPPHTK